MESCGRINRPQGKGIMYRVYFIDGNKRLFSAKNIYEVMKYLVDIESISPKTIWKIEEI